MNSESKNQKHKYTIADHFRASCFIIAEGVLPGGKQRGYVLRRLIRRSLSSSLALGIDIQNPGYYQDLIQAVIEIFDGVYREIEEAREQIVSTYLAEAKKFEKAIAVGHREWSKILK